MASLGRIYGYAIKYNTRSVNMGGWYEVLSPRALDTTLDNGVDLRALHSHDPAKLLGRLSARTLTVKNDPRGLWMDVSLPNTATGAEVRELVARRDLTGCSFAFVTGAATWSQERDGTVIRTVEEAIVSELSAVSWPCYQATEIAYAERSDTGASPAAPHGGVYMNPDHLDMKLEYANRPGFPRELAQDEFRKVLDAWKRGGGSTPQRFTYAVAPARHSEPARGGRSVKALAAENAANKTRWAREAFIGQGRDLARWRDADVPSPHLDALVARL